MSSNSFFFRLGITASFPSSNGEAFSLFLIGSFVLPSFKSNSTIGTFCGACFM